ncbi:tellurite resistance/C4-dicarboxylate transporter family protein [Spelaeicoccus albus]|uniref:Tellurite resistance protein TehA-like permease n=1 Tax=Spelaeicoccus albus TaxID=1280376 RepID=A0A7Z0D287_9MICO|nr:tellurite resistance/C4-dicarboxylate transporter family protein [Spelaeicoccus albus]NYI67515.1 tellurite resistance protein TehA-like permease [Spelaeicoccus albus]
METTVLDRTRSAVASLSPGYFALVMASGIISTGLFMAGVPLLSMALLIVCIAAFIIILALTIWRLIKFRAEARADFENPKIAFAFNTYVAGANVLAVRLALQGLVGISIVLLALAVVTWLIFAYTMPWTTLLGRKKTTLLKSVNGTWFVWVVASQSVAVASATVEPSMSQWRDGLAILAVGAWSVGVIWYVAVGIFVAVRLLLYDLTPEELNPPYAVSMGALAITILAGTKIVDMEQAPMVDATQHLIAGVTVVFWAFTTGLIPMLLIAVWWRHVIHRVSKAYEPSIWSAIFPLGMYAVASMSLGRADKLPMIEAIGHSELWFAFACWLVTLVSMLIHLWRTLARTNAVGGTA